MTVARLLAFGLVFSLASATQAQQYPNRPIRFLVPGAPGSSQDILARILGNKLSEQLGQQVVVDARAGASGIIGIELAKAAAPDGYTIFAATTTLFATLPALKPGLSYDADKDFAPLTRMASVANVLTVNAGLGVESVADTIPGYEITQWWGVAVPAKTSAAIASKLHAEIIKALQTPEVRDLIAKQGATVRPESPSEFAAFMQAERIRIGNLGKRAGITAD
jgi:tripartite-type tricarboxylate transporter receptor subunit TctC